MNNYCDSCGNCSRCGNCCTPLLPITRREEKRMRAYIKQNKIEPEPFIENNSMNLECCFYNRRNKVCKVYEVRPSICRSFKCNRNFDELEKEKMENHKRAYWNKIVNEKEEHLTDMRLLFYGDPRSLVANIIYTITNGTMKCSKKDFEFAKWYLKTTGQKELANSIQGVFDDRDD